MQLLRPLMIYCGLSLSFGVAYATPSIFNLLNNDIDVATPAVVFEPEDLESIARIRIHYLNSDDCQSGYAGFYDTPKDGPVFPVTNIASIALNATSTYTAASFVLGADKVDAVNSILIRLINTHGKFARFSGICEDQDINCCVPVYCSHETGTCLAKTDIGMQPFNFKDFELN